MSRRLVGERGYQFGWSKDHPRTLDQEFRTRKARKILAVLKEALESRDPSSMRALDVGASAGISWGSSGGSLGRPSGGSFDPEAVAVQTQARRPDRLLEAGPAAASRTSQGVRRSYQDAAGAARSGRVGG
jgi:hypothetical protein